ncbi:MAG: hypothetical protein JRJ51_19560 [Deltaproteobacteria bacterium]|nr:hypothetical protein [Deltaproteobacteria bacterium]
MAECLKKDIKPDGLDAPHSISDAQSKYFGIRDGNLSKITSTARTGLAESICLVATGAKSSPCYSIIDNLVFFSS